MTRTPLTPAGSALTGSMLAGAALAVGLSLGLPTGVAHATTAAVAPAGVAPAGVAAAGAVKEPPTIGGLVITPTTGLDTSTLTATSSSACPQGTNVLVKIYGRGFPADGQNVVPNSAATIYPRTPAGGLRVPLQDTLADFLKLQPGRPQLGGPYRLVLQCRNPFGAPFGQYLGTLTFSAPSTYAAQTPKSYPAPTPSPAGAGGAGAAGAQPGATGPGAAGPSATGFPGAPNAVAGPPTGSTSDRVSGGGDAGIPLPLVVGGLVVLVAGGALTTRRVGGARTERPQGLVSPASRRVRIDTTNGTVSTPDRAAKP